MKLGDGVEWALHCAAVLALLPDRAVLPGKALAEFHAISESYLLKHLKRLTAAGLLVSVPGPKGGYRLARPAADISLLDIVVAVEGGEPAFRCAEIRRAGPAALPPELYRAPCVIHAAMHQAEQAWRASLSSTSLAEIADRLGRAAHPDAIAKGGAWLNAAARS